jgi:PAS domain-containing protein
MNELIFRSALNTTNETVVIVDTDLTIQFANARFSTQMQAPPEDLQGTSLTAVCEPDTAATLFEHLDAALTGAPQALSGRNILNRRDQSEQITCTDTRWSFRTRSPACSTDDQSGSLQTGR